MLTVTAPVGQDRAAVRQGNAEIDGTYSTFDLVYQISVNGSFS
jgi:hypothetical protein